MIPREPVITHLGMVAGEWPVQAFTDLGQAAYWAAHAETSRPRYVWAVESITLGPCQIGKRVPETCILTTREAEE